MGTYYSPSGNPEVWAEKPAGYFTPAEWLALHPPPQPPEPTAEEEAAEKKHQAATLLGVVAMKQTAEKADMSDAQLLVVAAGGFSDAWVAGTAYAAGKRLTHGGALYVVMQPVTAQAHQPPGSAGMLAVYRPIEATATGTRGDPIPFVNGMDVDNGKHYSFAGLVYLAKADMKPCVWNPGTPGLWQWELVETPMAVMSASAARYYLTNAGTYHREGCSYTTAAGEWLSLADIAARNPTAKACGRCTPPALH